MGEEGVERVKEKEKVKKRREGQGQMCRRKEGMGKFYFGD